MRQKLLFLIVMLAFLLPARLSAFEYTYEGVTLKYDVIDENDKTCAVSSNRESSGDIVIPEVANDGTTDYRVTSIGEGAFKDCRGLKSVEIPNSVQTIGYGAFHYCSGLTSVVIPNSVQTIGDWAFSGCTSLASVVIPDSVQTIGNDAFYKCSGLKSVEIGNAVESIGQMAFCDCSRLTSVVIGNSVTEIGYQAFQGCSSLTSVVIPNSVQTIGDWAFNGCSGLTSVKALAESPAVMNDNSFYGLYNTVPLTIPDAAVKDYLTSSWGLFKNIRTSGGTEFKIFSDGVLEYRLNPSDMTATVIGAKSYSDLQIPERFTDDSDAANPVRYYIKGIEYAAFYGREVNSVEFNSKSQMEYIGDYAFANTKISSITLPETLKTIGDYSFYNTSQLSKVELKEGLESIGSYAFGAKSERFIIPQPRPLYIPSTIQSFGMDAFYNFECFKVNISDLNAWLNIDFGSRLANPLCGSWDGLYVNDKKLRSLDVPENIKEIKPYAFYNCDGFTEVKLSEDLQKIGNSSFMNCSNITSIQLPESLKSIADNSFYGCDKITELTIPSGVTEIGKDVFSVKSMTFADGLSEVKINGNPFYNSVTDLYWGRPLESLTFNIDNVTSLGIGNLITEIPDGKFKELKQLKSLRLGNSVETIGNEAFSGCRNLTDLKFASELQSIGDEAFCGCTSLEEVILPPSVETIGTSAFAGDSNLASIIMGHKVKTIGEKAFDGCKANTVSITAQTPPTAPNNTFSNYGGKLYLQGEKAKDAYYDAFTCWDRFDSYIMIDAEEIKIEGVDKISGKAGDTFQLTATVWPENVTLPQIFWRSTNPEIATVDENGFVTLHVDLESIKTRAGGEGNIDDLCTIIAETLYNDGPIAQVGVTAEDTPILVESLTIDPTVWSGEEGSEFTIVATVLPENAEDKTLTFESSDDSIATVDAEGNVKVLKEGTCVITVSTVDGSDLKAECVVTGLSGVEAIFADPNASVDVYDMNGVMLKKGCSREELKQLKPAVYILRSGDAVVKAVVR